VGFKKLNPIRHFLVCANDINLLGENIYSLTTDREFLFPASSEIGLEVNDGRASTRLWLLIRK
jgi:hypothetical protein